MTRRVVDASILEGGGQIIRYSFAMAAVLNRPLQVHHIRHNRPKPGLSAQHLTSLRLLKEICGASLDGDELGSTEVSWSAAISNSDRQSEFRADAGTAGAISLMIQAILPVLVCGEGTCTKVSFVGGTNVSFAPSIDSTKLVLCPLLRRMGINIEVQYKRRGYFPRGGGAVDLVVTPVASIAPISLMEQGSVTSAQIIIIGDGPNATFDLVDHIKRAAEEQWSSMSGIRLDISTALNVASGRHEKRSRGDTSLGIIVVVTTSTGCILSSDVLLSGRQNCVFARHAVDDCVREVFATLQLHLTTGTCCDEHMADQLLVFMALADGISRIRVAPKTEKSSLHIETAIEILSSLCGASFSVTQDSQGCRLIECNGVGYNCSELKVEENQTVC